MDKFHDVKNMQTERLVWVDAIKGFALLAVVLGHALLGYTANDVFSGTTQAVVYGMMKWIYTWHMPLFFAVSGFTYVTAYYRFDGFKMSVKQDSIRKQICNLTCCAS